MRIRDRWAAPAAACLLVVAAWLPCAARASDDWPQFRGPNGAGLSQAKDPPLAWSETENVRWKVAIPGLGRSSPVILGDRIWLTTALARPAAKPAAESGASGGTPPADGLALSVVCLDRATGRLVYQSEVLAVDKPEPIHPLSSHATPTPVVEPGRLYCDFGNYGTVAVDAATGRTLWTARLPVEHQLGPASSPALWKDRLFLVRDGCDAQYVAALDKHSGRSAWRTDRPAVVADLPVLKKSFSTPLVIESGGRTQVFIQGPHWAVSYDPATGKELGRVRHGTGYSIAPRPVFGHGTVYACTGGYVAELIAIRVDGQGDVTGTHVAWKAASQIPLMSSPLLVGQDLYILSDAGILTCLDALTGQPRWRERLGGNYAASPTLADGRIYLFSREGKSTILQPGPRFTKLAENQLPVAIIATPAFVGRAIYLRTDTHLYCIQAR
jgi:outer membrane protein assembly factor BamB